MSKSKFNWEIEKSNILTYIDKGKTNIEISIIYNVSPDYIKVILRRLGIRRRKENNIKLTIDKNQLYKLLLVDNYRFKDISIKYGVTVSEVRRICIEYGIYDEYMVKLGKKSFVNDKTNSPIGTNEIVPIKYSYPIVNSIYLVNNYKNIQEFIYIPEFNKWIPLNRLTSFLKENNINVDLWRLRWIYKFNGTLEEEINKIIEIKYSDKFSDSKRIIKESLINDINYKCDFFCTKIDLINEYFNSRDKELIFINYDFSKVPHLIKSRTSKFIISTYLESKLISFETDFESFIENKQDGKEIGMFKGLINRFFSYKDDFENIIKNYTDIVDYSFVEFKGMDTDILLKCKICDTIYSQTPKEHIRSLSNLDIHGCPNCKFKFFKSFQSYSFTDFINRSIEVNGDLFDFTNSDFIDLQTPIYFIDKNTKELLYNKPCNILKGFCNKNISSGEIYVKEWINSNNINYYPHKYINYIEGRSTSRVIIDFIIIYNNCEIWIEYNGIQHYKFNSFFHDSKEDFYVQLSRDQNVRDYCKNNNISFIEIPYTYNTYKKVKNLLDRVILGGEDINTIIDYSSLYKNN